MEAGEISRFTATFGSGLYVLLASLRDWLLSAVCCSLLKDVFCWLSLHWYVWYLIFLNAIVLSLKGFQRLLSFCIFILYYWIIFFPLLIHLQSFIYLLIIVYESSLGVLMEFRVLSPWKRISQLLTCKYI